MSRSALVLLLAVACAGGGQPRLEVSENAAARTAAAPRQTETSAAVVQARFRVHNGGSGDLVVHALVPDCACRAGMVGGEALAPGEDGEIAAACRVIPGTGRERRIRMHTNDPAQPETLLRVAMPVDVPTIEPAALYFGHVPVGQSAVREIAVRGGTAAAMPSLAAETMTVERGPARADGRATYRVRFTPSRPGIVRASLVPRPGADPVPMVGVGVARVAAFPAEIHLPSAVAEVPAVALKNLGASPLAITGVDVPAGFTGDLRTVVPGEQYRLVLRRGRGAATRAGESAIRVRTDAAEEPVLTIPIVREQDPAAAG